MKKDGGIIVKKEWILECNKKSKLLDVKDFLLKTKARKISEDESSGSDTKENSTRKAALNAKKTLKKIGKDDDDEEDIESENTEDREFIVDDEEDIDYENTSSETSEEEETSSDDDSDKKSKKKKKSRK